MTNGPKASGTPVVDDEHRAKKNRVHDGYKKEHTGVHVQADLLTEAEALDEEMRQQLQRLMQSGKSIKDAAAQCGVSDEDILRLYPSGVGDSDDAGPPRDEATQPEFRLPNPDETEQEQAAAPASDATVPEAFLPSRAEATAVIKSNKLGLTSDEAAATQAPYKRYVAPVLGVLALVVVGLVVKQASPSRAAPVAPVVAKEPPKKEMPSTPESPSKDPEVASGEDAEAPTAESTGSGGHSKPVKKPAVNPPPKQAAQKQSDVKEPDPKPKAGEPKTAAVATEDPPKPKQEVVQPGELVVTVMQNGVTVGSAKVIQKHEPPENHEPPVAKTEPAADMARQRIQDECRAGLDKTTPSYQQELDTCNLIKASGKQVYFCCVRRGRKPIASCQPAPCQ